MNEPPLRTASSASVRDHYHGYYDPTGRPPTIAELAELARAPDRGDGTDWEEGGGGRDLKHWLRLAQRLRNDAKALAEKGKVADAFVQYARSATIVLERLPTHPDYQTLLTQQQRQNLGLVGVWISFITICDLIHNLC
jgi:STAM-binding protein